jgi:molybdopterin molybdotransferase
MTSPASQPGRRDVRMRGFPDRAEVEEVIRLLDERVRPLPAEVVPVPQAGGRVLAAEVISEVAVPGFDRAAMDGYAVRAEETFGAGPYNPLEWRVLGEALPGRPFAGRVAPGQAVRIMTGAPVPAGTDSVVPVEVAQEEAGVLRVTEPVSPGRHVGRRGEDIEPGRAVLPAGRRLRPQDLGLLGSIGVAEVAVTRRPRIDILITGDELLPVGSKPEGYRIVDSNSVMLAALARRDGGEPRVAPLIPDRRDLGTGVSTPGRESASSAGSRSVSTRTYRSSHR